MPEGVRPASQLSWIDNVPSRPAGGDRKPSNDVRLGWSTQDEERVLSYHDNVAYDGKRTFTVQPGNIWIQGIGAPQPPIASLAFKTILKGELKLDNGTAVKATFYGDTFRTVTIKDRNGYGVQFRFYLDGKMSMAGTSPATEIPHYQNVVKILKSIADDPEAAELMLVKLRPEFDGLIKSIPKNAALSEANRRTLEELSRHLRFIGAVRPGKVGEALVKSMAARLDAALRSGNAIEKK
jgi:hypothetical protein